MSADYQNILTDLVKRIRPLLVGVAKGVASNNPQWIQPIKVYSAGAIIWTPTTAAQIEMPDAVDSNAFGTFMISPNFSGIVTIEAVFHMSSGSNNVVITHHLFYGGEGDSSTANVANYNSGNPYTYTPSNTNIKVEFPITFTATGGEFLHIYFGRDGTDANDTAAGHVRFWGWKVSY